MYQRISPGPRHMYPFRNSQFLRCVASTLLNPQAGRLPLVGHPRLLIQYIHSYPPYRRPFPHTQPDDVSFRVDVPTYHGGYLWIKNYISFYSLCKDLLLYVLFVERKLVS